MFNITIEPGNTKIVAIEGEKLSETLARAGVRLMSPCGGSGTCGKCRVKVLSGVENIASTGEEEKKHLSKKDLAEGWRMACRVKVQGDVTIEIPRTSLLPAQEGLTSGERVKVDNDPVVQVKTVVMPVPSLEDQRPDDVRLSQTAGVKVSPDLFLTRDLPGVIRRNGYKVDVIVQGDEIVGVLDPHSERLVLGLAVDIGTTTLAVELVDLKEGRTVGVTATSNPQGVAGADVISRIEFVKSRQDGLGRLSKLVVDAILGLLDHLLTKANARRTDVYEIVIAGNTTMLHLLLAVDPAAIAEVPFTPVFYEAKDILAEKLGIGIAPGASIHCLPSVSGYVGADVTAGLAVLEAASLNDRPAMFIDIGTNGEMVLLTKDVWYSCSTAAGPAFEGAKISCGMRAIPGAIDRVQADTEKGLVWATVEGQPPQGICGSGIIDAAAAFLKLGLMEPAGNFVERDSLPEHLRCLMVETPQGDSGIEVAPGIVVTQKDIRELQLGKGAVSAGASIMLKEAGLTTADITHVYIAGAFGSFIRAKSAIEISIVPPGITEGQIRFLGNTALVGARLGLVSKKYRKRMDKLAREVKYIELSGRPDFQMAFAEAMFFGSAH